MLKKTQLPIIFSFLILLVVACFQLSSAQGETTLFFPLVGKDAFIPLPPADEATERISLPPGFEIRIFAQNLSGRAPLHGFRTRW